MVVAAAVQDGELLDEAHVGCGFARAGDAGVCAFGLCDEACGFGGDAGEAACVV